MILDPDFTMKDDCCSVSNDVRVIIKTGQRLNFESPIYADTLNVVLQGTVNTIMVKNVDWTISDEDIDYDTMGQLRLAEPDFNTVVLKSVTVIKTIVADIRFALEYQRVYPLQSKLVLLHGKSINIGPNEIYELINQVAYLTRLTKPVTTTIGGPHVELYAPLEIDRNKERPENFVLDELHDINTPADLMFIRPCRGSFFKDSLVIRQVDTGSILKEDVDYVIFGPDYPKIKQTSNKSGLFNFIMFIRPYVGKMSIDYHAFGGDVHIYDYVEIQEAIHNVVQHLQQSSFLTAENVGETAVLQEIIHTLIHLGDDMRRLIKEGRPSYGDVTSGNTLLRRIVATDSNMHWWDIATMYKVDTTAGTSEVITADSFHFRITTNNLKLMFEAVVNVNLNNEFNIMVVDIVSDSSPKGYIPFVDYSKIDTIVRPQLRIVYNKNTEQNSGVVLQLGLALKNFMEETICIKDLSDEQSCWQLIPERADDDGSYRDDLLQLPNPSHIWDDTNPDSKSESTLVPFKCGHLVWAGSESLNRPSSGFIQKTLAHFLDDSINISCLRGATVELEELGGNKFSQFIPFISGTEDLMGNVSFYYNGAAAYINLRVFRDTAKQIKIVLDADITTGLSGNQLDLRHVFVYS